MTPQKKRRKIDADKELFGLLKIPDNVLLEEARKEISELKIELGKMDSYIMELEHTIEILKGNIVEYIVDELSRSGKDHYRVHFAYGLHPEVGISLVSKGSDNTPLFVVTKTNYRYTYIQSLTGLIPKVGGVYLRYSKEND